MATIKKFEDLLMWKKARILVKEIYIATNSTRDRGFNDQIRRAAVSVLSNISEGFERGTKQEFLNYLFIAKGSAGEVRAQLYIAYDLTYLNTETFKRLKNLAEEVSRLIYSFVRKVKTNERKGLQYKHEKTKDPLSEYIKNQGFVMTPRGMKTKEEAIEEGLEILEP